MPRLALASSVAALLLASAAPASAFCRSTTCKGDCPRDENGCPATGLKLFWASSCVSYSLQKDGTQSLDINDVRVVVQKSFQAWAALDCGNRQQGTITFSELEDVECKKTEYNTDGPNVNVVFFQDNDWTYTGIDGTLAKTIVTFDDRTGEIYDADIDINAAENNLTVTDSKVGYDLQSIVTHEAGHFIGMAHSPYADATMYASYTPGTIQSRTLNPDDMAGACTIYPPNRGADCNLTPRGGLGTTCDSADSSSKRGCRAAGGDAGNALLGVAVALVFVTIRRTRRAR
jgi:hypothetical protein